MICTRIRSWVIFSLTHKNYNFLDCYWFKKLLFSTSYLHVVIGQFNEPITLNNSILNQPIIIISNKHNFQSDIKQCTLPLSVFLIQNFPPFYNMKLCAGARFVYHEYDYKPSWTTRSLLRPRVKSDELLSNGIKIPLLISLLDFSLSQPFMSLTEKVLTTNSGASLYCTIMSDYKRVSCNAFVKRRNYNIHHIVDCPKTKVN